MKLGFLTAIICMFLLLVACTDSTSSNASNTKVKGKIYLTGASSNADAIIALYNYATEIQEVKNLRQESENIAFVFNQNWLFNHRNEKHIALTETDDDGDFSLNVNPGTYNVVFFKEEYGFFYKQINVTSSGIDLGEITLNPEVKLPSAVVEPITFETNTNYVAAVNGTSVTADITVQPGAILRIRPATDFKAFGKISSNATEEKPFIVTTNDGCSEFINDLDNLDSFSRFIIDSRESTEISNIKISETIEGLKISNSYAGSTTVNHTIQNCFVNGDNNGIHVANTGKLILKNAVVTNFAVAGISSIGDCTVENSIVLNCTKGFTTSESEITITNSAFLKNFIGFQTTRGVVNLSNNLFEANDYGVSLSASNPNIMFNSFSKNKVAIETCRYYVQASFEYCNPIIENNNFYEEPLNKAFSSYGENSTSGTTYKGTGINRNINIPNNYFKYGTPTELIRNESDFSITIEPVASRKISEAGLK